MADCQTTHCVDCMTAAAAHFCGHVLDGKERILAGWCCDCWDPGTEGFVTKKPKRLTVQPGGYVGPWQPAMGKVRGKPSENID